MAFNEDKLKAARERLKQHPGGENLEIIDSKEMAREYQKRSVEARKRNKLEREAVKDFMGTLKDLGEELVDVAPKGVDVMRFFMLKAMKDGDEETAGKYAEKIASYETPKLAAQEITQTNIDLKELSDEEFEIEKKKILGGDNG